MKKKNNQSIKQSINQSVNQSAVNFHKYSHVLSGSLGQIPNKCKTLLSVFTFHLSPRLSPSTAGCSPPSMSSIVFCLLLSCSRWFTLSFLCRRRLAIFCLVDLLISSLSLVATLCSVWSTYCPSFLLCVLPSSTFVSVCIL